ncbi:FAD-dependent oxidoreductase [Pseudomonas stutzeri]|nr:FAD-dependent oxidoreductase [Stutzerimonas stutzeri]
MSGEPDLLLVGAGHVHLGVLRLWAAGGRPPGRIVLLSPEDAAWYSGMLPGLLAGRYALAECRIPLAPLCAAAGVDWRQAAATALEADAGTLQLDGGERLAARWLSLDVGAPPRLPEQDGAGMELLAVKPFPAFVARWRAWQDAPAPLAILGGGAAGVELALALARRVPALTLLAAGELLGGHPPGLRRRALRHLRAAGVELREHCPVARIRGTTLLDPDGRPAWQGPRLLVASGARPLPWLRRSALAGDRDGFVAVAPSLRSLSHPQVFASGDCAGLAGVPHNGVHAVRQGPLLADNLARALGGLPLADYRAQRHSLALLADGQGGALLSWAGWSAEGRWCGLWKDWLDRRFVCRHRLGEAG